MVVGIEVDEGVGYGGPARESGGDMAERRVAVGVSVVACGWGTEHISLG